MLNFYNIIKNNNQFIDLCNKKILGNSFLFESDDNIYLENFVFSFAKKLLCEKSIEETSKLSCEKCLSCKKMESLSHPDLIIYPKFNQNITVDDVKDLIDKSILSSIESDKKIFVFKNFSFANIQSQNKLLKILEEPPKNVFIFLCVENINKILPTILSRCNKVKLKKLSNLEILGCIDKQLFSQEQLDEILNISQGSIEKAIKYSNNKDFLLVFENCFETLINLKDSTELLNYSSKFTKSKEDFIFCLQILESIFRDVLLFRLNKKEFIVNKNFLDKIIYFSKQYDCDAIDKIIKKIYEIKSKLDYNCNFIYLCDSLLLYILEVRYYANFRG